MCSNDQHGQNKIRKSGEGVNLFLGNAQFLE